MRVNKTAILLWAISSFSFTAANADVSVVTSIKPVHSLVSGVMEGVSSPIVIIEGAGSPHTYSLKPSQARQLQDADLVFWMGDELETFLEGPIKNIAKRAKSIKLIDSHGLKKIKFREGGMFEGTMITMTTAVTTIMAMTNTPKMIMTTMAMTNTPRMIMTTMAMTNTPRMIIDHDKHAKDDHDDMAMTNTPRMIMTTMAMTNTPRMIMTTMAMTNTPRMIMTTMAMASLTHMYG